MSMRDQMQMGDSVALEPGIPRRGASRGTRRGTRRSDGNAGRRRPGSAERESGAGRRQATAGVGLVKEPAGLAVAERAYGVRANARTLDDVRAARARRAGTEGRTAAVEDGRPTARTDRRADHRGARTTVERRHVSPGDRAASLAGSAREFAGGHRRLLVTLAVIAAVAFALFGPAQRFYVSMRTNQDLQLKYDTLVSQNEELTSDVDTLMSKEGIEDEARKNGYVGRGETGADVEGLTNDEDAEKDEKDPSAAVTYEDDRAWYVKALDTIFGYDREEVLK